MAGATERTRQSELAPGKTKGTQRFFSPLSHILSLSLFLSGRASSRETEQMNAAGRESP